MPRYAAFCPEAGPRRVLGHFSAKAGTDLGVWIGTPHATFRSAGVVICGDGSA